MFLSDSQPVSFSLAAAANSVTISWTVKGNSAPLVRVEIWRAPDNGGSPGTWSEVVGLRYNMNSPNIFLHTGSAVDTPGPGGWWYGLHVVDANSLISYEPSPLFISISEGVGTSGSSWYVDKNATGANNGSSWANAWSSFSAINWSQIQPGDTVYISGGPSSKIYYESLTLPLGKDGVTIRDGTDNGHNGEVIIDGQGSGTGITINGRGSLSQDITIKNMTVQNFSRGIYGDGENSGGLQNIVIDNCQILNFKRAGVFFEGNGNVGANTNIVVKNSYFNDDDSYSSQSDAIYVQYLNDFTADHNRLVIDNPYAGSNDLHSDNIQSFWVDNIVYSNNIALQQSAYKVKGTQLYFIEEGNGVHKIFNNVAFSNSPNAQDSTIRIKRNSGTYHAFVYGNSVYTKNDQTLNTDDPDTVIENNIFYSGGSSFHNINVQFGSGRGPGSVVDYNIYYNPGMTSVNGSMGPHDISDDPLYMNTGNINTYDLTLQSGSPGIDAGTNLGLAYNFDINGLARPQGVGWDIGAYEHEGSSASAGIVAVAAADIAYSNNNDADTAALATAVNPDIVLVPGDLAYNEGTIDQFNSYYHPTWGQFYNITYPAPGNHEYRTGGAAGYFDYFAARVNGRKYYSFDIDNWHIISLNSEQDVGSSGTQASWLVQDLAANSNLCTIAFWHQPRFSSNSHGDNDFISSFWDPIVDANVDIILNGHDHGYERFVPMDKQGDANSGGPTEFVVGSGGKSLYTFQDPVHNTSAAHYKGYGILKLVLYPDRYEYEFVSVNGDYSDSGSGVCH